MADRSVAADDTFAVFRKTMNETNTDIGDMTQLGNSFSGTPTDMVEACNAAPSVGFAIAMCAALG
jgi:hypothetical protein